MFSIGFLDPHNDSLGYRVSRQHASTINFYIHSLQVSMLGSHPVQDSESRYSSRKEEIRINFQGFNGISNRKEGGID